MENGFLAMTRIPTQKRSLCGAKNSVECEFIEKKVMLFPETMNETKENIGILCLDATYDQLDFLGEPAMIPTAWLIPITPVAKKVLQN